jgi:hypothetical protein
MVSGALVGRGTEIAAASGMALPTILRQSRITAGCLILLTLAIFASIGMCALGTFSGGSGANGHEQVDPAD